MIEQKEEEEEEEEKEQKLHKNKTKKSRSHILLRIIILFILNLNLNQFIFQISIFECKIILDALTPTTLKIKVHIRTLLLFFCQRLGTVVSLEPCGELLVEAVRVPLQFLRRQIMLIRSLLVVEDEEEGVGLEFLEYFGVREARRNLLRVVGRSLLGVGRDVGLEALDIGRLGEVLDGHVQHTHG